MPAIPASSGRKEIPIGVVIISSCRTSQLAVIGTGVGGAGATTLSICALPILFRSLLSPISSRAGAKGNCRLNCKKRRGKKNKERHQHLGRHSSSVGSARGIHLFIGGKLKQDLSNPTASCYWCLQAVEESTHTWNY